jgi:signal transduction histidine kinase
VKDQVTTQLLRRSIRYSLERSQILQQLRASERATQEALDKERELNQLKSYFVSMVPHEFRNPLNTLRVMSEVLVRYGDELPVGKKQTYAQRIEQTIEQMCQLLDEVILLGKVESGHFEIVPKPLNLAEFCDELIAALQLGDHHSHPVTLTCQLLSETKELDGSLLRHILTNLISNALKYSPAGQEVQVDVSEGDGMLRFCIRDRGIGIPAEEQSRLFQTFSRCSNVGAIQGTGLGLAIVKRCVELCQGKIQVDSQINGGTTVTVLLPLL